jgi:isopropylmalate/homocitrate/citramalate synthase
VKASVIESPISDLKLDALGVTRAQMLQRIRDAISNATEHGIRVAFFGVDSTRAQPDFFAEAYRTAVDAGAQEVVVVDTIGIATPEAAEFLVRQTREWVGADIPVHWHGHNDFGLATACSVAAVKGGARWIQGTINGMGERAGNANLAEVALALRGLYGVQTNLRLDGVRAFTERLRQLSGYELEPFKPVFGENLFTRESGAVAAQFHEPEAIEPYASDVVGAERRIVLGKKSGIDSIRIKAQELGLELTEDEQRRVLAEVKKRGTEKRGLVTDEEFLELARA